MRYGSLVQASQRGFAGGGGPKKPALGPNETDFDLVLVGKLYKLIGLLYSSIYLRFPDFQDLKPNPEAHLSFHVGRWPQLWCPHQVSSGTRAC